VVDISFGKYDSIENRHILQLRRRVTRGIGLLILKKLNEWKKILTYPCFFKGMDMNIQRIFPHVSFAREE
jgi:hypothetical protein